MAGWFDSMMIRRFRRSYEKASGIVSPRAGFEGMVDEVSMGLKTLSLERRERIDDEILPRLLLGPLGNLVAKTLRRVPRVTAFLFHRSSPLALHYLVGESRCEEQGRLAIPCCRFRKVGGEEVCRQVCKLGTERFFREHLGARVELTPDEAPGSCACVIRFG